MPKNNLLHQLGMNDHFEILDTLARTPIGELRRILHPHDEVGFRSGDDRSYLDLRRRLDEALDALTLLEIGLQLGLYDTAVLDTLIPPGFRLLVEGEAREALLRYAGAYLYFGVRMLAGRLVEKEGGIDWPAVRLARRGPQPCTRSAPNQPPPPASETNPRFFHIATPPTPAHESVSDADALALRSAQFLRFLELQRGVWKEALQFLDDFHEDPAAAEGHASGESAQYELWLRGLITEEWQKYDPSIPTTAEQDHARARARTEAENQHRRFDRITKGLTEWLDARVSFYLPSWHSLSPLQRKQARGTDALRVQDPVAARFALADIYWIARLLRAEVSGKASVTYARAPWTQLLRFHATLHADDDLAERLRDQQEIIRSIFDFVCDLAQNAVAISEEVELAALIPEMYNGTANQAPRTWPWRPVFNEELTLLEQQRKRRAYMDLVPPPPDTPPCRCKQSPWAQRLITGVEPHNRVGLAFSGGGVRSASFNLGVLQGLQGFDLLRQVDYISTVSGGGFIGAWLVGNVQRTRHWLGKTTCWDESVTHLRAYSSYLAPITGILSADTWVLAASWIRNTFLVQLSGLVTLFTLLLLVLAARMGFVSLATLRGGMLDRAGSVVGLLGLLVMFGIIRNFIWNRTENGKDPRASHRLLLYLVLPAWLGSFLLSAILWAEAHDIDWLASFGTLQYSHILVGSPKLLRWITVGDLVFMSIIAWFALKPTVPTAFVDAPGSESMSPADANKIPQDAAAHKQAAVEVRKAEIHNAQAGHESGDACPATPTQTRLELVWARIKLHIVDARPIRRRLWRSAWISILCAIVLYLVLCAILFLFLNLISKPDLLAMDSFAFVFGPALVLTAFTLSVVLYIGLSGRVSNEPQREWWTRYGAWLTIFATVGLGLSAAAVLGPELILWLAKKSGGQTYDWKSILTGLGSVITTIGGGLFAGKSSKTTGGEGTGKKFWLELCAKIGALVFILSFSIGAAFVLYLLLVKLATNDVAGNYWKTLDDLSTGPFFPLKCTFHLTQWTFPAGRIFALILLVAAFLTWLFSKYFDINLFGLSQFYRNRLVRCYLGATRWAPGVRRPHPFTKFDFDDDIFLSDLKNDFRGPFPIFNCTLNLTGSTDLSIRSRHSASFSLTPLRCGADRPRVGYAPTGLSRPDQQAPSFAGGVLLGQAVAISGAAVSSNMGYNTSPLVALLLTMFNVRLGWWFPNPGQSRWMEKLLPTSFFYLVKELFGIASDDRKFLDISDGGHFENLGVYELIRRRCKVIIASDAECDEDLEFGGLGNLVRICATDFGAIIDIDVKAIRERKEGRSLEHCTVGKIKYSNGSIGYLLYLKASVTGDEDIGIAQYRSAHPSFPHEATSDQFFTEGQFESYRKLGLHIVRYALRGTAPGANPLEIAERLSDVFAPKTVSNDAFLRHTQTMQNLWSECANTVALQAFATELMTTHQAQVPRAGSFVILHDDELCMALKFIQLMEDVFLDLRLDDYWDHPDNRGWAIMFMRWARSPRFQRAWIQTRRTFGIRFEYFCEARLGLTRDIPIVRI
ncbi:patatin-like phospholipase family protein [Granulicella sibirica]|uniref:PNPLA domain-containing protein n=1 Tax=Granulicella sibirica TaxID=2479048 RepID=A0A4Q0SWE5_9BACT|nr:patatin-like phospholipase family protein [Granulicella sibirica]RXH54240.1 hypothetical protein GRAN_4891 [Granulicella sibirica]